MFGLVSKKKYKKMFADFGAANQWLDQDRGRLEDTIVEKDKILKSTERAKVLEDLELALNLILAYQRALVVVGAADPNILKAKSLLEKWGKKGDPNAPYLGFTSHAELLKQGFCLEETPQARWKREEEEWGDEAYGTANVRIEAEAIDEGDEKEPGFTRARIRFVEENSDADPVDPST